VNKRVFFSLCLILILSSSLPAYAFAGSQQKHSAELGHMQRWINTAVVTVDLYINSNGRAELSAIIIGNTGVESITATAVLERIYANGTTTHIRTWSNMRSEGNIWGWEGQQFVARGHDYRFTVTATVVRNGVSETVSLSRTSHAH